MTPIEMPVQYRTIKEHAGQRLDNFLIRELKNVPRARIYRMIRRGEVRVNSRRMAVSGKLRLGDIVRIPPVKQDHVSSTTTTAIPLWLESIARESVIYEDDSLIVLNKPAGVAVHGGSNLVHGLIDAMRRVRGSHSIDLIHRLDRDTSGCLLMSKSREALLRFSSAFREGTILKRYLAIVHGNMANDKTDIVEPLLRYRLPNGERRVGVDVRGQRSVTKIRVLDRCASATYIEAMPKTGRTHQIRAHLSHLGHPIMGDEKYGSRKSKVRVPRLMLHAVSIALQDGLNFEAKTPSSFGDLWTEISSMD